jgi:hypothetical protein
MALAAQDDFFGGKSSLRSKEKNSELIMVPHSQGSGLSLQVPGSGVQHQVQVRARTRTRT